MGNSVAAFPDIEHKKDKIITTIIQSFRKQLERIWLADNYFSFLSCLFFPDSAQIPLLNAIHLETYFNNDV